MINHLKLILYLGIDIYEMLQGEGFLGEGNHPRETSFSSLLHPSFHCVSTHHSTTVLLPLATVSLGF